MNQAAKWIDQAVEKNPDAYFMHYKKAQIQAKLGNKKEATASAQKAIDILKKDKTRTSPRSGTRSRSSTARSKARGVGNFEHKIKQVFRAKKSQADTREASRSLSTLRGWNSELLLRGCDKTPGRRSQDFAGFLALS